MSHQKRCIILIIRITASLVLVLVWITRCPYQKTGRGLVPSQCVGKLLPIRTVPSVP